MNPIVRTNTRALLYKRLSILATVVVLLSSRPALADQRQLHLTFTTSAQSVWGPGGATPVQKRFTIIDPTRVNFDVSNASYPGFDGPFESIDTFWGDADFGAAGKARAMARLGLWADINMPEPGSVDVTYSVIPVLHFPDPNSFRAGDTIAVSSEYVPDPSAGASIVSRSPKADIDVRGDFAVNLDLEGKLCLFSCLDTQSTLGIPSPMLNWASGESSLFKIHSDASLSGDTTYFEGMLKIPDVSAASTLVAADGTIATNKSDTFADGKLSLAAIITKAAKLSVPLKDSRSLPGGISLSYVAVDALPGANVALTQKLKFTPKLKVAFTFPEPLQYWVNSGPPSTSTSAEMSVGDTMHIVTSKQKDPPEPVAPTFRLDNDFHCETGVDLSETITARAAQLNAHIPSVEIIPRLCIPGFCIDLGPFGGEQCTPELCTPSVDSPSFDMNFTGYDNTWTIAGQHLGDFVNDTWTLGGFVPKSASSFLLDPENPIIRLDQQTGLTRNLGGGKRQVTFALDISNPGDVTLSKLSLTSILQNAFSDARSWSLASVSSCGLAANPSFDGNRDPELLASGNVLAPGATKRVIIVATVAPKPDPQPYVDHSDTHGRSPLETPVESSASSSVLLGPSHPQSADDFVLFGEHFVKFDSAGTVFGDVGSNDQVEIKNGTSGMVAGDLRAGKYIKVSGEVAADYAISGGAVDVVGNGRLTLSGNVKEFQTIATLTRANALWQPASALLGDVWVPIGGSMTIDPGFYNYVTINDGGRLELHPGTYSINNLQVKNGASVRIDGPATLLVGSNLDIGSDASLTGVGSTRGVVINALQPGDITTGSTAVIRGTFIAARSNLTFGPSSRIEGSVYGKSITLNKGVTARYHYDCDRLIDANCDGWPDCP